MKNKTCKVLFLIPTLTGGGAERVITTLLRHLDRSRFRLTLGVIDMRGAVFQEDLPPDVSLVDLGSARVRFALFRIIRLVWSVQPRVVVSTLGHLNLALTILRPFLPSGVRIIGRETIVVSEGLSEYHMPRVWKTMYRVLCKRLDHVVCQSTDMQNDLAQKFFVPPERMTVIHNPVDIVAIRTLAGESIESENTDNSRHPGTIQLVAAGRLAYQKGFDLLIEALALCNDPRLRLQILGDGPLAVELADLASRLGVADQCQFLGFRRNPYPFFSAADAFVLSSRYEGFPNVILEALACGTPVIATPAPGVGRELLASIASCELAAAVSASALADAIKRWCARDVQRVDSTVVTPFSVHKIARAYESEILRVANAA
jgi:glycosyltransferase involved in cell wall biosynthesis